MKGETVEWTFRREDLEALAKKIRKREENALFIFNYSLRNGDYKIYKRNQAIEFLVNQLLKNSKFCASFLDTLNRGDYQFLLGNPVYVLDKYEGKSRPTLDLRLQASVREIHRKYPLDNIRFLLEEEPKVQEEEFSKYKRLMDYIALLLIANKLQASLSTNEQTPYRNRVIQQLIRYLEKHKGIPLLIFKGDFRDYTLNIPRKLLFEKLEERNIPTTILKMIKRYFNNGNEVSFILRKTKIEKLFLKNEYLCQYEKDSHFRNFINKDGILPGTPLSNILGQIFLLKFDQRLQELAGPNGFFVRFFDDFLLIKPLSSQNPEEEKGKIQKELRQFLSDHYQRPIRELEELVRFEWIDNPEIEFLGYLVQIHHSKIKTKVRYKSLKKFSYKYLVDYRFKTKKKIENQLTPNIIDEMSEYWGAKCMYLYVWIDSFYYINDPKLLDEIYLRIILPDFYSFIKRYDLHPHNFFEKDMFKIIKAGIRPTTIHRLLKQFSRKELSPQEEKLGAKIPKPLKMREQAHMYATDWRTYLGLIMERKQGTIKVP